MKKRLLFPLIISLTTLLSCQKEIVYEENPFLTQKRELEFKELKAIDPVVVVDGEARIKAVATGDELVFEWTAPEGNLIVNDTISYFSSDQEGEFAVTCTITDKYGNSDVKEVLIQVTSILVFTGLSSDEEIVPEGFQVIINATASGESLTYQWSTTGGNIEGNDATAVFSSNFPGIYSISCTVTDLVGDTQTHEIEIEVIEGFLYKSLTADPDRIPANDATTISATALGNGLSYTWKCDPPATLLGSGNRITFTICHADVFTVTCEITDEKGNSQSKSVTITVTD